MKKQNKKIKIEPTTPTQTTTFKFCFPILGSNKKYIDIQSKYIDAMISYTYKTIKNASDDDMENLLHDNGFEFTESFELEPQTNKLETGTNIIYGIKKYNFINRYVITKESTSIV